MARHIDTLLPTALATLGIGIGAAPAAAQTVGVNASVINDVRMTTEANPAVHKAVVKERVSLGNDIQTGKSSILQVLLLDRTSFTVGGNARVKVDRFVYDPSRSASAVGLAVAKGAFRFMSGKPLHASPGQSTIRTPIASIGIRGTIVEGVVGAEAIRIARGEPGVPPGFDADPDTASLVFLRGPGAAAQGEQPGAVDVTAGGSTVTLSGSGSALFVPAPGQPPIGPFTLSAGGSTTVGDLLRLHHDVDVPMELPLEHNPIVDLYFEAPGSERQGNGQKP